MWVSKDEKDQERKRREDRTTKQVIQALMGFPNQYQGGNRYQGGNNNNGGN
jgi:hypothetical protein